MAILLQYLSEERVVVPLTSRRKTDAIRELASVFESSPAVPDFRKFLSALFQKESRFGSGVEKGVALPHYRDDCIAEPVVSIGLSVEGLDWGNGERVHVLVLIGWPDKHQKAYLQTVAEIARVLHHEETRKNLLRAKDGSGAIKVIRKAVEEREQAAA